MTTSFNDTFTGTGALAGHVPDTTFNSYVWTGETDLNLSGGKLTATGPTDRYGSIGGSWAGTGNGGVTQYLSFDVTTGPLPTTTGDHTGVAVAPYYGTTYIYSFFLQAVGGVWSLNVRDATTTNNQLLLSPVTVDPNTTYKVVLGFTAAGPVTLSALGQSGSCSLVNAGYYTSAGLKQIDIGLQQDWSLDNLTLSSIDPNSSYADLIAPKGLLTASGVGPSSANLICPSPSLAAGGASVTAVANLTCPSTILVAGSIEPMTATAYLTAPSPTLYAVGHDSTGKQAAYLTAPSPLLAANGGANAKLTNPTQTLAATGTTTLVARATLTTPSPALSSSGTGAFVAGANLKAPSPNLVGYGGAVCSITLTGKATLQATGTTGGVAGATLTCPLFELTTSATKQAFGSANLLCPSPELGRTAQAWLMPPMGTLTAIGTAVIAVSYEAYAVNLLHTDPNANDEATRYTNFPFTHVVRYQNSYYGANSTGLYLLEGTTDAGAPIPWEVKTAITDFKSPMKKVPEAAYFSGRFGPNSTIRLHVGEKTPITYAFSTPRGQLAQNHRQKFGKGKECQSRYYALSASGAGEADIDGIEPVFHNTTRRI